MIGELELYQRKFLCPPQKELYVYGDYNSHKGSMLNIQLHMCHDRPDCKSEAEIKSFLRGKFFILLFN